MLDLSFRLKCYGGLWHWEVLTERGLVLGHGATLTSAAATAEAMAYGVHPARSAEIDAIELAKSANRLEIAHRAFAEAEQSLQMVSHEVKGLIWLCRRSEVLTSASRVALAESRKALAN